MNKDIFEGKWHQLKGALQSKWGKLTKHDLDVIEGSHEELYGILLERYGMLREDAEKQVKEIVTKSN